MRDWNSIQIDLKSGSKNAFRLIYDEYYEMLLHISRQYITNREDAKEAVQDAFLKLWEYRSNIREDANIRNFLYTIVKNNCLNILKRKQLITISLQTELLSELHFQYEALARLDFNDLEYSELKRKIDVAVEKLPDSCRIVFKLSRYDQLMNKEIASQLNITEKTVEAHMTKALKILRIELKEYLPVIVMIFCLRHTFLNFSLKDFHSPYINAERHKLTETLFVPVEIRNKIG